MLANKHISIIDKHKCSGCNACAEICPKQCISMEADKLGCRYPQVDVSRCIECGACLRVCPFINPAEPAIPQECYAAVNENTDERMRSSSGGVFIALARLVIAEGGVVFGAMFDAQWNVVHVAAETIEDVLPMVGSKYVQSNTSDTFAQAKAALEADRKVLYSGTPCQIAGLRHFLRKDYDNLLAVEVICHGVPVPTVWQSYLNEEAPRPHGDEKIRFRTPLKDQNDRIAGVSFRDKRNGWKKYGFALRLAVACDSKKNSVSPSIYQPFKENAFMKAFLRNWSLRPSCYDCQAKSGRSHADLTIGDFWGVERHPELPDDDRGTSCVVVRSPKGADAIKLTELRLVGCDYTSVLKGNPSIEASVAETDRALRFMRLFLHHGFSKAFYKMEHPTFLYRCFNFAKRKLGL